MTSPVSDDAGTPPPAPASPTSPKPEPVHPPRPSGAQILASVLTATTTTFALSYLGVAGTIIGAGLASTFTVLANYWYTRSIIHTQRKVTQFAPKAVRARAVQQSGAGTTTAVLPASSHDDASAVAPETLMAPARAGKRRFIVPIAVLFVLLLGVVTVIELGIGKPLSDALRGQEGTGTSVFHNRGQVEQRTQAPEPDAPAPNSGAIPDDESDPGVSTAPEDDVDPGSEPSVEPTAPEPAAPAPEQSPEPAETDAPDSTQEPAPAGDSEAQAPTQSPTPEPEPEPEGTATATPTTNLQVYTVSQH